MDCKMLMHQPFLLGNETNAHQMKGSIDFFVDEITKANNCKLRVSPSIINSEKRLDVQSHIGCLSEESSYKPDSYNKHLEDQMSNILYIQQDVFDKSISCQSGNKSAKEQCKTKRSFNTLSLSPSKVDIGTGYHNLHVIQTEVIFIGKNSSQYGKKGSNDYDAIKPAHRIASLSTKATQNIKLASHQNPISSSIHKTQLLLKNPSTQLINLSEDAKMRKSLSTSKAVCFPDDNTYSGEQIIFDKNNEQSQDKDPSKKNKLSSTGHLNSDSLLVNEIEKQKPKLVHKAECSKIEDYAIIYHNIQKLKQDNICLIKKNKKLSTAIIQLYQDSKTLSNELESHRSARDKVKH